MLFFQAMVATEALEHQTQLLEHQEQAAVEARV
jgi:hypothetical protein